MRNAYGQVLRVYLRKPFRSFSQGMFVAVGLFTLGTTFLLRTPHLESVLTQMAMGMFFLNMVVWLILYEQVVGPRLRLWPNFIRPQLAVFTGIAGLVMVVGILALSGCAHASTMGAAALIAGFFALVGVMIAFQSVLTVFVYLGIYFWVIFGPGMLLVTKILTGEFPNLSLAMVAGSFVVMALVLLRLFTLNEESPGYRPLTGLAASSLKPRMTGEGNQVWARMPETGFGSYARIFRRQPIHAGSSWWSRAQRWRCQSIWRVVFLGTFMGSGSLIFSWFFIRNNGSPPNPVFDMTLFLFVLVLSQQWLLRWRYIETELLRPVDRNIFFKELGLAMMMDCVIVLAVSLIIMALPVLLWSRSKSEVLPLMLNGLMHLAVVIFMFGYSAWVLRHRSKGKLIIAMGVVVPISMLSIDRNGPLHDLALLPWIFLSGVALVGFALAVRGYRLWLTTELG